MTTHETFERKVLPFETAQGKQAGHAIILHKWQWMKSVARSVVFRTFCQQAEMAIEIVVDVANFTKYTKKMWPAGGQVVAVICEDGSRIHAEARYVGGHSNESYEAAPLVCRDAYAVVTLSGGYTLLEVAGVQEWIAKQGKAEILDPWARDNAAFNARMAGK